MQDIFSPIIPDKTIQYLFAPMDRPYAEFTSGRYDKVKTLKIPRMSLTRGNPTFAIARQNHARIPKLGFTSEAKTDLYSSKYPIPIDIPYQMDLWVGYEAESQALQIAFMRQMVSGIVYPTVYINEFFLTKYLPLILDGSIVIAPEPDIGGEFRLVRATIPLKAETWIFADADNVDTTTTIREILLKLRNLTP